MPTMFNFSAIFIAISVACLSTDFLISAGENKNSTRFASGLNSHSTAGKHFVSPLSLRATITEISLSKSTKRSNTLGSSKACSILLGCPNFTTPLPS